MACMCLEMLRLRQTRAGLLMLMPLVHPRRDWKWLKGRGGKCHSECFSSGLIGSPTGFICLQVICHVNTVAICVLSCWEAGMPELGIQTAYVITNIPHSMTGINHAANAAIFFFNKPFLLILPSILHIIHSVTKPGPQVFIFSCLIA